MIIRTWRGLTEPEHAEAYIRYLEQTVLPRLRGLEGFVGVDVLRRSCKGRIEFMIETRWTSMDAIKAAVGEDPLMAIVEPQAQALLVDWDRTVRHYTHYPLAPPGPERAPDLRPEARF